MNSDARLLVEWVLWNVRLCDLPDDVKAAAVRLSRSGRWPKPEQACGYGDVAAKVTAFPRDESRPLTETHATRQHLAATVERLAEPGVSYLLVWMDPAAD